MQVLARKHERARRQHFTVARPKLACRRARGVRVDFAGAARNGVSRDAPYNCVGGGVSPDDELNVCEVPLLEALACVSARRGASEPCAPAHTSETIMRRLFETERKRMNR